MGEGGGREGGRGGEGRAAMRHIHVVVAILLGCGPS